MIEVTIRSDRIQMSGHAQLKSADGIDRVCAAISALTCKVSVGDTGLNSADVYKIRIPDNVGNADLYLPPEEYAALENPSGHWTIQNDDHIVLGVCDLKIERPAELQAIRLLHCKVTSWSDNRFGGLPHWRIGGE